MSDKPGFSLLENARFEGDSLMNINMHPSVANLFSSVAFDSPNTRVTVKPDGSISLTEGGGKVECSTLGNLFHGSNGGTMVYGRFESGDKPWATWRYKDGNTVAVFPKALKITTPKKGTTTRLNDFPLKIPDTLEELVETASGLGEGEIIWCSPEKSGLPQPSEKIKITRDEDGGVSVYRNNTEIVVSEENEITVNEDSFKIREEKECCICLSENPEVILLPCGHKALCSDCSRNLIQDACPLCPLCRTAISSCV